MGISSREAKCLLKSIFSKEFNPAYTCGQNYKKPPKEQTLRNGKINGGSDFDNGGPGGSIGYLADPKRPDRNLINTFDQGRQVQMSFLADPLPYSPATEVYPDGACTGLFADEADGADGADWPWNPIDAGDVDGGSSEILQFNCPSYSNNNTMSLASRPLQWACHHVPCECKFHKSLQLVEHAAAVKVTATLRNQRTDEYDETFKRDQELPAVYTNGILHRLINYNGSHPFQDEPVVEYDTSFDEE